MTVERGLRPTSPVHVHVEDDVPVHLHVKKKTKSRSSVKKPLGSTVYGSSKLRTSKPRKSTPSPRTRSKSPGGHWIPAPAKTSKSTRVSWQGPTHRLEITPPDPIRLEDLDTDEEDNVHGKMRNYEKKIDSLMNEVGSLKTEAELQKTQKELEERDDELNSSRRMLDEQAYELLEYKDELTATERENSILRKSVDLLADEADLTRNERDFFNLEREKLIKKLIEVEMDGQAAAKQVSELRDSLRRLREENRISASDSSRISKIKDLLLEKLSDFEATNRTLRRLLRDQHHQEAASVRLNEQRDVLLRRLTDADSSNDILKREMLDRDLFIGDLKNKVASHQEEIAALHNLQDSLETTRGRLQKQLRTKEADCNRMAVQIRGLESELAQNKIDIDHYQNLLSTAKERADKDKESLKKATRVQKQRAERSQDALEQLNSQLLEKDNQFADVQSQLSQVNLLYDKLHKEKAQNLAENNALKTRIGELESVMHRVEDKTRIQIEEATGRLHEKTSESAGMKLENERLKTSIITMESKFHQAEEEISQLRENLKQYEGLIDEYRSQMNLSRREADDTLVRLEEQQKQNSLIQRDGEVEIEKVKVRLQQRLQELEPLPELLRSAEIRLQDANGHLSQYEKKNADNTKFIAELTAKVEHVTESMEEMREKWHNGQDENRLYKGKVETLERQLRDIDEQSKSHTATIAQKDEIIHQLNLRMEDRVRENTSLTRQLENALTDIRRHQDQSKDKQYSKERTFQTRILDLESQLSQTRAEIARIKREKEENERKFNSRLYDLKDRLEQSHSTNRSMQNYVQFLKNSYANVFGDNSVSSFPVSPIRQIP